MNILSLDCSKPPNVLLSLPENLKAVPVEIWKQIFNQLLPQDLYCASLSCRLWKIISTEKFNKYRWQIFDCIQLILGQIQYFVKDDDKLLNKIDLPSPKRDMNILNIPNLIQYKPNSIFNELERKDLYEDIDPNYTALQLLDIASILMNKFSKGILILDLGEDWLNFPVIKYISSKLKIANNLVYTHNQNFTERIKTAFNDENVSFLCLSIGVLNDLDQMHTISLCVKNSYNLQHIILTNQEEDSCKYYRKDVCLIKCLFNCINIQRHFSLLMYSCGIDTEDIQEIARLIKHSKKVPCRIIFNYEENLNNDHLEILFDAINNSSHSHFYIEITSEDTTNIETGIALLKTCPKILLVIN